MKLQVRLLPQKRDKRRLLLLMCVVLAFAFISLSGIEVTETQREFVTRFGQPNVKERDVKKILIWKPFLSKNILEEQKECLEKCDARCDVTDVKSDVSSVDSVIFHLTDLWKHSWSIGTKAIVDLPKYRDPAQIWVLWNMEPPVNLFGNLGVFRGLFNWTMFYRSDSTVWWPYGARVELSETEHVTAKEEMKGRSIFKEKKSEIVGRISNCKDMGRRYRLVHELQKYLPIDMYGTCYNNPCGAVVSQWDTACDELLKNYKFYLAFENSQCTDYVTEKYWWSLRRDQIPIVNWKKMNKDVPIPHSYINIFDFKSMEDAAAYIKQVSTNETLYNSYFNWKLKYKNEIMCPVCRLCRALHENSRPAQVYTDLEGWIQDDACEQVGIFNNIWKEVEGTAFWIFGL